MTRRVVSIDKTQTSSRGRTGKLCANSQISIERQSIERLPRSANASSKQSIANHLLSRWCKMPNQASASESKTLQQAFAATRFLSKDLKLRLVPREVKVLLVMSTVQFDREHFLFDSFEFSPRLAQRACSMHYVSLQNQYWPALQSPVADHPNS